MAKSDSMTFNTESSLGSKMKISPASLVLVSAKTTIIPIDIKNN
jgi:hypothetical protein